ncbi:MAG: PBP1b-binding outer membrane lipoprotein LpoB, partial [Saprospiraceae bacterium]
KQMTKLKISVFTTLICLLAFILIGCPESKEAQQDAEKSEEVNFEDVEEDASEEGAMEFEDVDDEQLIESDTLNQEEEEEEGIEDDM